MSHNRPNDYCGARVFLEDYRRPVYSVGVDDFQSPQASFAASDYGPSLPFESSAMPVQSYRMAAPSSRRLSADPSTITYVSRSSVGASEEEDSLFDTEYGASSGTEYSVAPDPDQQQWFQQLPHATPLPAQPTGPHLWCEFNPLLGCRHTFPLADKETWINHHLYHHLECRPPSSVMCWFCDNISFPSPQSQVDRIGNFRARMNHIYEHIRYDRLTLADIRPDFFMVKHLLKRKYLSNEQATTLLRYDERPERLRSPEPFLETRSNMPSSASYNQGVPYDLAREERHRRRERGKGSRR